MSSLYSELLDFGWLPNIPEETDEKTKETNEGSDEESDEYEDEVLETEEENIQEIIEKTVHLLCGKRENQRDMVKFVYQIMSTKLNTESISDIVYLIRDLLIDKVYDKKSGGNSRCSAFNHSEFCPFEINCPLMHQPCLEECHICNKQWPTVSGEADEKFDEDWKTEEENRQEIIEIAVHLLCGKRENQRDMVKFVYQIMSTKLNTESISDIVYLIYKLLIDNVKNGKKSRCSAFNHFGFCPFEHNCPLIHQPCLEKCYICNKPSRPW